MIPEAEIKRLQAINDEYHTTLQVLAVLTERLAMATGEPMIVIADDDLTHSPDLIAQRDEIRGRTSLSTAR